MTSLLLSIRLNKGSRDFVASLEMPGGIKDARNYDISLMRLLYSNQENPGLQSDSKQELDYHFNNIAVNFNLDRVD